jgi:hypothetical protein
MCGSPSTRLARSGHHSTRPCQTPSMCSEGTSVWTRLATSEASARAEAHVREPLRLASLAQGTIRLGPVRCLDMRRGYLGGIWTRLAMSEASARAEAESNGAEERIRTSTRLPGLAPEASASAIPPLPQVVRIPCRAGTFSIPDGPVRSIRRYTSARSFESWRRRRMERRLRSTWVVSRSSTIRRFGKPPVRARRAWSRRGIPDSARMFCAPILLRRRRRHRGFPSQHDRRRHRVVRLVEAGHRVVGELHQISQLQREQIGHRRLRGHLCF